MKRVIALALTALVCLLALAACGGGDSPPQSPPPGGSQPVSSQPSAPVGSVPASSSVPENTHSQGTDLSAAAQALAEAAGLGETFEVTDTDLALLGGMDTSVIEAMAGLESTLSSQNGGSVIVLQVAAGQEQAAQDALVAYRDAIQGNADYEEFANARTNIQNARITSANGLVVYAVSATGEWDALDAAIDVVLG